MSSQAEARNETAVPVSLDFEQAFAVHQRVVYRYACALTHDAALAEDVTQEVFLKLYQNLNEAQHDGLLRAWLLSVTAKLISDLS